MAYPLSVELRRPYALMTQTTTVTGIMIIHASKAELKNCGSATTSISAPKTLQRDEQKSTSVSVAL